MKIIASHSTIWITSEKFNKLDENEIFKLNEILSGFFEKAIMNYHKQLIVEYDESKLSKKEVLDIIKIHIKHIK